VLLQRSAANDARASLRKCLDWTETPRWHEAGDVPPQNGRVDSPNKVGSTLTLCL